MGTVEADLRNRGKRLRELSSREQKEDDATGSQGQTMYGLVGCVK